jgi:hypothetical protein
MDDFGVPSLSETLATYRVAHVFDCFANFPAGFAKAFLDIPACVIGSAFRFELLVVNSSADSFFRFSFSLIQFSFYFIPIW